MRRARSSPTPRRWRWSTPNAITDTRRDVDDELFARVQRHYDDDTIAELTMIIAWENASSRFNRAFRIPSQGFWTP
jgi:alkylhydroperoxidase family enzyme